MHQPLIVHVPTDTPANASVFLAGSLPGVGIWKADGVQLARADDGTYSGSLALEAGQTLEYKFTLGRWDAVEKAADGSDRANRVMLVDATAAPIMATVERWASEPVRVNTVVGSLQIVQVPAFGSHGARTIRVWLPPSYDANGGQARFPVLYLQDGQNCFDRATSAYGSEWQVDETLTRLIAEGSLPPLIAVGIDNAGVDRTREYTFDVDPQDGGGGGAEYADLVLRGVMPFVEQAYRVQTGPAGTFIGGSSLGALVSLEVARRHPGVFGGVLAMSPALWWDNQTTVADTAADPAGLAGTRVWIDIGTREVVPLAPAGSMDPQNQLAVEEARRLDDALRQAGIETKLTVDEGAQHNEIAWAKRFPAAVRYLLARQ
ncbi:MAG: hypothetical protein INR62_00415 [Rhodospirillales bacterium]|nr:hypothetical protein [Acetobacter sp.]